MAVATVTMSMHKYGLDNLNGLVECDDRNPLRKPVYIFLEIEQYVVILIGQRNVIRFGRHAQYIQA